MDKAVHGGDFFKSIGADFSHIDRRQDIVSADVLDAWYPPTPGIAIAIAENLEWLISTSPPTHSEGLRAAISDARGMRQENLLVGSGTSSLMFLMFPQLLNHDSTLLLEDPSYGEYRHLAESVIGCQTLTYQTPLDSFEVDLGEFQSMASRATMAVLVNPNSPTGRGIPAEDLAKVILDTPNTLFWIDETYIDFYSNESRESQSLERHVRDMPNLIVAKSMSKYFALSGLRIGYVVASEEIVGRFEKLSPPWAVGMIGQLAAIEALKNPTYYYERSRETSGLRRRMARQLSEIGLTVPPSTTNFLLARLPRPEAAQLCKACAEEGIYLRNCDSMSDRFQNDTVRIAVKSADANRKIVESVTRFLN